MRPTRHPLVRDFYGWLKEKLAERVRHGLHNSDVYRDDAVQWLRRQKAPEGEKQQVLKLIGVPQDLDGSYYVACPCFDLGGTLKAALDLWDPVELPLDLEDALGCFACIPYLFRGAPQTRETLQRWYREELWLQYDMVPEHLFDQVGAWLYPNIPRNDDDEVLLPDWGDLDAALEILVDARVVSLLPTGQYRFEGAY